jgi:hypothetical protein
MPLRDHFRSPIADFMPWESTHSAWATRLADALNDRWLSGRFLARERARLGPHLEIDVASFELPPGHSPPSGNGGNVAVRSQTWAPPQAVCSAPASFPDTFEVLVLDHETSGELVAAIELISPSNKDRPSERGAFVAKCASYLHQGVSVALIDVVTNRHSNLHNELATFLRMPEAALLPESVHLYAAAYRPALREGRAEFDIWRESCELNALLPTMPLRLTGDLFVPVEFEATYAETCRRRRVP